MGLGGIALTWSGQIGSLRKHPMVVLNVCAANSISHTSSALDTLDCGWDVRASRVSVRRRGTAEADRKASVW